MAHDHAIRNGDHVVRLAYMGGHSSVDGVWQHSNNAELREARPDPGVLAEGDVVHVPDAPPRSFDRLATRRKHRLVVELPQAKLRVVLQRSGGVAYAGVMCRISVDGEQHRVTTDAHGCLEFEIGPQTRTVDLVFADEFVQLAVAHLQPVDTVVGVHARLENLGYRPGALDGNTPVDRVAWRGAVEEFQCDHGLVVDGEVADASRQALLSAHGA